MNPGNDGRAVFDASAVLALMQGEPGADRLVDLQPDAVVNAVNAAEVLSGFLAASHLRHPHGLRKPGA